MSIGLYNNYMYMVVLERLMMKVYILSVSLQKNYYTKTFVYNMQDRYQYNNTVVLVAENQGKSRLEGILFYVPGYNYVLYGQINSLMTMRIDYSNKNSSRSSSSLGGLGSSPPFNPNIWTGEISSSTQGSSLYTIPGVIRIISDISSNYDHKFDIKVLSNETNSAELNLPRKFYFYEGAVPSYLPISKQLFQGYAPEVSIKGKDSSKLQVIFINQLTTEYVDDQVLPTKIELIYHLDEGLFLILDHNNMVTIYEFSAKLSEKIASIKVIYTKKMPQNELF